MNYILVYYDEFTVDLLEIEDEEDLRTTGELVMYLGDDIAPLGISKGDLMREEPWERKSLTVPRIEEQLNVALYEALESYE